MSNAVRFAVRALLLAVAVPLLATTVAPAAEGWLEDFAAAKAQAAKEGKDLFIDFTGSDWCGWCIRLDKEVLLTPEFKDLSENKGADSGAVAALLLVSAWGVWRCAQVGGARAWTGPGSMKSEPTRMAQRIC